MPQLQVLQQLGRTYRTLMSAFEANIGHSLPRWRILLHLYQGGEASQKQLAGMLRIDPAALTRQIKAIEGMGWVERHSDPVDNRLTNVALTPAGTALVEAALPKREAFIESALGDFSAQDLDALETILGKLEQRLRMSGAAHA
jgi:DNA-binding MarR family transcriptional regulator